MRSFQFKNAKFIISAKNAKNYPVLKDLQGKVMPEVAVAGRSNVGKSSLMNALFQSKGLVKTSSTPGKTQLINFFTVDERLSFVDLPGYGYAEVPLSVKKEWGPMVQTYLTTRSSLKLVLCLFDIRRTPNDDDFRMLEWAAEAEKAVILVLTKVDKVTQNEKKANTQKILNSFGMANLHYVHFSSVKNIGRRELIAMIQDAIIDEISIEEKNGSFE